jgi:hypothetical protein
MTTRHIGQSERWVAQFKDEDGVLFDPDDVNFEVTDPDGDVTTYVYGTDPEVTKVSTGVYRYEQEWTVAERWSVRAYSASPAGTQSKKRTVVA